MKKFTALLLCLALLCAVCPVSFSDAETPAELPASFDLRNVDTDGDGIGDRCYVTPVRNQNPFGTCWGFAAVGAAEISILGSVYDHDPDAWKTLNLSEKQLVYFSHVALDDPENPQNGEGAAVEDVRNARSVYNSGSPVFLATSAFAQGIGPSDEDAQDLGDLFRYSGKEQNAIKRWIRGSYRNFCYSDDDDWSIPEEYRFRRDYLLRESFLLPSPASEDEDDEYKYDEDAARQIKLQLLQKRGVSISFSADTSNPDQDLEEEGRYLNTKTWAHYTWDNGRPNHAVTLIGWDDNYPKENFFSDHQPPADGAWLVKNSWGAGNLEFPDSGQATWGIPVQLTDDAGNPVTDADGNPVTTGSGYFWLSYYDRSLDSPEAFVFEYAVAPEYVDQHDYMQTTKIMHRESETPEKMANIFTAPHSRILSGFSCLTADANTKVEYEIRLLCKDYETPEDGLAVASGEVTFPYGGYHKVALPDNETIFIQRGQPYAIVLTMTREDGTFLTNENTAFSMPGDESPQKAVVNERESYILSDGAWIDYKQFTAPETEDGEESLSTISYDNFPIKGYGYSVVGDLYMHLSVANRDLTTSEGENETIITLYFKGVREFTPENPKIEWTLLKGSEDIAEIEPQKEGSSVRLTVRKPGTVYLGVSVKDFEEIGTSLLRLRVRSVIPQSAEVSPSVMEYTGEKQMPEVNVTSESGDILYEGEDFEVSYRNNEKCGIALADLLLITEDEEPAEPYLSVPFAIIPEQAEITSLSASDGKLIVSLRDQWESGITEYEIEYRKSGEETWTCEKLADGNTEWALESPESGAEYEFRTRAVVDAGSAEAAMPDGQTRFPGDYSDVQKVTAE